MVLIVFYLIIMPNKTQGALQANGDTAKKDSINNWMINIRKMQSSGGALGLTDTINSNLTSENKNLDIHMEKNTEYGAMVILSASSYGNPNKVNDGETTTGNETGVAMNINKEWTAMGCVELSNYVANFKNALARYKNIYPAGYAPKVGDAIQETQGWHGSVPNAGAVSWGNSSNAWQRKFGILRGYSGGIFSYMMLASGVAGNDGINADTYPTKPWYSRAVVVVGSGV